MKLNKQYNSTRHKIDRPNWFTLEKYMELKDQGLNDKYIRNNILFVSESVLTRFKKEIGWEFGKGKSLSGGQNKKNISIETIKVMRSKGMQYKQIYKQLNIGKSTLYRIIAEDEWYVSEREWQQVYTLLNREQITIETLISKLNSYTEQFEDNESATKVLAKILLEK